MDYNCKDQFQKVITDFITHTVPEVKEEFIETHMLLHDLDARDQLPYILTVREPITDERFLSFIGKNNNDSTEAYCANYKIKTTGPKIDIVRAKPLVDYPSSVDKLSFDALMSDVFGDDDILKKSPEHDILQPHPEPPLNYENLPDDGVFEFDDDFY